MEFTEELAGLVLFIGATGVMFRARIVELFKRLKALRQTGKDSWK